VRAKGGLDLGQQLWVVSSSPELGGWKLERAVELTWSAGDGWTAEIMLPPGSSHMFKVGHSC
jgi:hypothetical protein